MTSMRTALLPIAALLAAAPHHHAQNPVVHFFFHLGVVGLLLVSIVDSSFVPLPIPGVTDIMLIVYAAAHENVFLLVAAATVGSALGGLISHAVGQAGGIAFLQKHVPAKMLARVTSWMERHAILAVSLPAILPPPMPLSPFVLVAGAVKMSRKKFMWAFTVSRFVRHALAVWLGVHYGRAVLRLWSHFTTKWGVTMLVVLWTVILGFTAWGIWRLYKTSKGMNLKPVLKGEAV
jgi:membrane protein YqaA with SNARE-associated domain